jgi:hypothetical protein
MARYALIYNNDNPVRFPYKDVLRLGGLLACLALATSRLGLVMHEVVGHGGAALAVGAHVTSVHLFYFAGGWIRYRGATSDAAALAVAMGGIAVELLCAAALWRAARGEGSARRLVRGIACALVVHATWYLATGTWHGYGDGALLYHLLGGWRRPFAIGAGLAGCAAAFAGAREVTGVLADAVPSRRVLGPIVAALLAAGVNVALAAGELHLRHDATYHETMQPEREREIEVALARWQAEQRARGVAPDDAARAREAAQVQRAHPRGVPFAWLLAVALAASALAGLLKRRPGGGALPRRVLARAAVAAAVGLALVVAIQAAFGS